jgi:hypothetical protein
MTAPTADDRCLNPEHPDWEGDGACPRCYASLNAEVAALTDRYMKLLIENGELRRQVRDAESSGTVPMTSNPWGHGYPQLEAGPAGAEIVFGTSYLQARPRSRPAREDVVLLSVGHRTTGHPRSILLERPMAAWLHSWLASWLAQGWPGVPRRCGEFYRPDPLHMWQCDAAPGHDTDHEGPCQGWSHADGGRPGRASWPLTAAEKAAIRDAHVS